MMDGYILIAYCIIIISIFLILYKLQSNSQHIHTLTKKISILTKGGQINMDKQDFIILLSQLKCDVESLHTIIDEYADWRHLLAAADKSVLDWVNDQNLAEFKPLKNEFALMQTDGGDIENEKERLQNKTYTANKIISQNCKEAAPSDTENTTQNTASQLINQLAKKITAILIVLNNCDAPRGVFNITIFEELKKYRPNLVKQAINNKNTLVGRNNTIIMSCYDSECGLNNGNTAEPPAIKKAQAANRKFAYMYNKTSRFNTINE